MKTKKARTTATPDPYSTLGVSKSATKDEIKKAYYDLAKQHHPDAGGDGESFLPVKLAYETLIDDDKRAFFDQHGAIPGSKEAQQLQAAYQGIGQMFLELLTQYGVDGLKRLDVVTRIRLRLQEERKKNEQNLKTIEKSEGQLIATLQLLSQKLSNSDPKQPNVFQQSVQSALDQCAAQRATVTSSIAIQDKALEILKSFTFDFEKGSGAGAFSYTFSVSTAGW